MSAVLAPSPLPLTLGIDPGVTGAAALIDEDLLECIDLPTCGTGLESGRLVRWIDVAALDATLRDWSARHGFAGRSVTVVLERPIAMPNLPATTIASQFDTFGALRGIVGCRRHWRVIVARPQDWKRFYGLKGGEAEKSESRRCAERMYPNAPVQRAKDHNRAEAVLIAHWGKAVHS